MPVMAPINLELHDRVRVTITEFVSETESVYRVSWNDYVINEWEEYFDSLSHALVRVGALSEAILTDTTLIGVTQFNNLTSGLLDKAVA
jgi:hypothetical protein